MVHQIAALCGPLCGHRADRLRGAGLSGLRYVQDRAYRFHSDAGPGISVIVNVQMPDASSIERTDAVMTQLSDLALKTRGIQDAFAVSGFSILTRSNSSAAGLIFVHSHAVQRTRRQDRYDCRAAIANRLQPTIQQGGRRPSRGAAPARCQRDRERRRIHDAG